MNVELTPTLTHEEARLVRDLLELYSAAVDNPHGRNCECDLCAWTETCGEHNFRTHDSLEQKVKP